MICIIQTGALIAQGIDQDERELRAKQMIRVDQWMTNMFATLKAYDRRIDQVEESLKTQKQLNKANADWMLEASKRIGNGTKRTANRSDQ